jgi:hypothetical protein
MTEEEDRKLKSRNDRGIKLYTRAIKRCFFEQLFKATHSHRQLTATMNTLNSLTASRGTKKIKVTNMPFFSIFFFFSRECLLHNFGENQVPKIISHRQHQAGVFPVNSNASKNVQKLLTQRQHQQPNNTGKQHKRFFFFFFKKDYGNLFR